MRGLIKRKAVNQNIFDKVINEPTFKDFIINEKIRAQELRVILQDGTNLGVIPTREAVRIAREREQDVVLISENANPPVAKILDFNKFLYEEKKKDSATKAKSKKSELKEFVFGPRIGDGDLNTRIERARGFIEDGNRVKITFKLRGREMEFPQIALEKAKRFEDGISEVAKPESEPKFMGNMIIQVFVAKK